MISERIIKESIKGNREAHKKLYDTCAPYVYSIVQNYIWDTEFRKDAMQEVFAQIFFSLKNFDNKKGSYKSWMARLTVNRCITLLKNNNKLDVISDLANVEDIPEEGLWNADQLTKENIEAMLSLMPNGYRTIFLCFI